MTSPQMSLTPKTIIVHATTIATFMRGQWQGVLIMGPSGIGKSDLALRALDDGFQLVSDDYSHLWLSGHHLYARAPDTIAGRIEVRGIGILPRPFRPLSRISLCVHCQNTAPERLPEPMETVFLGKSIPALRLNPLETSTVSKLRVALGQ